MNDMSFPSMEFLTGAQEIYQNGAQPSEDPPSVHSRPLSLKDCANLCTGFPWVDPYTVNPPDGFGVDYLSWTLDVFSEKGASMTSPTNEEYLTPGGPCYTATPPPDYNTEANNPKLLQPLPSSCAPLQPDTSKAPIPITAPTPTVHRSSTAPATNAANPSTLTSESLLTELLHDLFEATKSRIVQDIFDSASVVHSPHDVRLLMDRVFSDNPTTGMLSQLGKIWKVTVTCPLGEDNSTFTLRQYLSPIDLQDVKLKLLDPVIDRIMEEIVHPLWSSMIDTVRFLFLHGSVFHDFHSLAPNTSGFRVRSLLRKYQLFRAHIHYYARKSARVSVKSQMSVPPEAPTNPLPVDEINAIAEELFSRDPKLQRTTTSFILYYRHPVVIRTLDHLVDFFLSVDHKVVEEWVGNRDARLFNLLAVVVSFISMVVHACYASGSFAIDGYTVMGTSKYISTFEDSITTTRSNLKIFLQTPRKHKEAWNLIGWLMDRILIAVEHRSSTDGDPDAKELFVKSLLSEIQF
ncbi:hypothetical protein CC2G_002580 [Coprinopsis cinerea AmutBmut pab1-1]|nr:hypothetical protein CC2G_002580 [Coprinopsis cinerea AmutBmut pab1-1]